MAWSSFLKVVTMATKPISMVAHLHVKDKGYSLAFVAILTMYGNPSTSESAVDFYFGIRLVSQYLSLHGSKFYN